MAATVFRLYRTLDSGGYLGQRVTARLILGNGEERDCLPSALGYAYDFSGETTMPAGVAAVLTVDAPPGMHRLFVTCEGGPEREWDVPQEPWPHARLLPVPSRRCGPPEQVLGIGLASLPEPATVVVVKR
jgi:hypothetical protein